MASNASIPLTFAAPAGQQNVLRSQKRKRLPRATIACNMCRTRKAKVGVHSVMPFSHHQRPQQTLFSSFYNYDSECMASGNLT